MSQDIVKEVTFLFHSIILGIMITFVYDGFIILRRLVKHNALCVSLEDIIFWISCAIGVFYMLCEENNGILRWFSVLGAAIGMFLYKKTVSRFFIDIMSTGTAKMISILFKFIKIITKPIFFAGNKISGVNHVINSKMGKIGRIIKKKLTNGLKLLKITLCKH